MLNNKRSIAEIRRLAMLRDCCLPRFLFVAFLIWSLFLALSSSGCEFSENRPAGIADEIDWRDVPQFKSISLAGKEKNSRVLWIVTVKGELFRQTSMDEASRVQLSSEVGKPEVISFVDSLTGWIVNTESIAWRTINGGQSWQRLATTKVGGDRFYLPQQLTFVSESNGWLVNNFNIWRTDDGGASWKHLISSKAVAANGIWKLFRGSFIDGAKASIATTDGALMTEDGGTTWQPKAVGEKLGFKDVQFINERTGWIAGGFSGIYQTNDGGLTWSQSFSGKTESIYLNSVCFSSITNGWAVGFQRNGESRDGKHAVVLHTVDGGKTWQQLQVGENDPFFDRIYFADDRNGWLFGRDNVYGTQNGGETWQTVLKIPPIKNGRE